MPRGTWAPEKKPDNKNCIYYSISRNPLEFHIVILRTPMSLIDQFLKGQFLGNIFIQVFKTHDFAVPFVSFHTFDIQ